ncbi:MAG: ATP-binding protein [Deltaproteobacteria bacterium]|nr:ATP-binding protein [Deltaproteobacteria bacterium]
MTVAELQTEAVLGVEIARQMLMLGARSCVTLPEDAIASVDEGWPVLAEEWAAMRAVIEAWERAGGDALWRRLRSAWELDRLSTWLTVSCMAVERHPEAAGAASLLAEDDRIHLLTPIGFARLAVAALGASGDEALKVGLHTGPALTAGLLEGIEPVAGRPVTWQGLRLSADAFSELLGTEASARGAGLVWRRVRPGSEAAFAPELIEGAVALLAEGEGLCIRTSTARWGRQLAVDLAGHRGVEASIVTVEEPPVDVAALLRLPAGLRVLDLTALGGERLAALRVLQSAQAIPDLVAVVAPRGQAICPWWTHRRFARARPGGWAGELDDQAVAAGLARRFRVGVEEVRAAVSAARFSRRVASASEAEVPLEDQLRRQLLAQGSRRMGPLVTLVASEAQLEHLVVPPALRGQLEDIVKWYEGGPRVYGEMGLSRSGGLGMGLTCLFSGPPGTGKTFAAQGLANALGLNLYRIDLSQVVSKYIGETEKALGRVFDEAEAGHGVLLFDEADALFGKRSEVKDAHDRYANIEVGYLLQRLEAFEGVTILTTNLRSNIDPAFVRRLRFVLGFPMPDPSMRWQLWEQALPTEQWRAPDLDLAPFVARFGVAGGNISNIGVAAAHLAAATPSGQITAAHVVRATYRELEKIGASRDAAAFGPLAPLLTEVV